MGSINSTSTEKRKTIPCDPPGNDSANKPSGSRINERITNNNPRIADSLHAIVIVSAISFKSTREKIPEETQKSGTSETIKNTSRLVIGLINHNNNRNKAAVNDDKNV